MNCDDARPLIAACSDGELDLVRSLEVEEHLRSCDSCAASRENLQALKQAAHSAYFRAPDGLQMGDLSRRMLVTGGNVTGIVDQLERAGLIARTADPADRRAYRVKLTKEGRRTFGKMASERGAVPGMVRCLHERLAHQRRAADHAIEPGMIGHFDNGRYAAPFVADHHAERVLEFDFAAGIGAVA